MPVKRLLVIASLGLVTLLAALPFGVRALLGSDAVRAAVEQQASRAVGAPVRIARLHIAVFPRAGLEMGDVTIGDPVRANLTAVQVSTGLGGLLSRRVEDAEVSLEGGRIPLPFSIPGLERAAATTSAAAAPAESPGTREGSFTVVSIRTIRLREVEVVSGNESVRVDLDSSLAGDRLEVTRVVATTGAMTLDGRGELRSLARREGSFTVDADTLDVDRLAGLVGSLASASASAPDSPSERPPAQLTIALKAPLGRAGGVNLVDLDLQVATRADGIIVDPLRMGLFGGRFDGLGAVDPSSRTAPIAARGALTRVDVAEVVAFTGSPGAITGRLEGTIGLTFGAGDLQKILASARGSTELEIRDGRLPGIDVVRSAVLAFGRPSGETPKGAGDAYSRLAATITLADRVARIERLTLAGRDLDIEGAGTLGVADGALDLGVDVTLSEELSGQAGRDLYRYARDGKRIVLPARIRGTIAAPSVFIDIGKAAGRAIRNKLEEKARSILDDLLKGKR
jgi:uncharacterized protein involved in outer membrane biogenesis